MSKARTFFIVTGANRGIGKQIALDFAAGLGESSTVMLLGRKEVDLEPVASEIRSVAGVRHVLCYGVDLQEYDPEAHKAFLCRSVPDPSVYEQCLLINNAGTLEAKRKCLEYENMADISNFLTVNVASAISLTSVIVKYFAMVSRKVIVNITSKAAVTPMKSLTLYCTAKPLTTQQTISRLLAILREDKYKSGDHIDFFDSV